MKDSTFFFLKMVLKEERLTLLYPSSSSSVENEVSAIAAELMNAASPIIPTIRPTRAIRHRERGIVIGEPIPQIQKEQQAEAEASNDDEDPEYKRKGKS